MNAISCQGAYHNMKPAPFKHCPDCGAVVNPKAKAVEDCTKFHTLRKTKGYRYCPDCGGKLTK